LELYLYEDGFIASAVIEKLSREDDEWVKSDVFCEVFTFSAQIIIPKVHAERNNVHNTLHFSSFATSTS